MTVSNTASNLSIVRESRRRHIITIRIWRLFGIPPFAFSVYTVGVVTGRGR